MHENASKSEDCIEYPDYAITISFIYLMFILIFGGLGNALVLFIQVQNKQKSSTDYLVSAMGASDLMCSIVKVPLLIIQYGNSWDRVAGNSHCQVLAFFAVLFNVSVDITPCVDVNGEVRPHADVCQRTGTSAPVTVYVCRRSFCQSCSCRAWLLVLFL